MTVGKKQIKQITDFLTKNMSAYLIILFGSAKKGIMRQDSDVDIAFLTDKKLTDYETFLAAQELADILGRDVDLVNLDVASTVFKSQVFGTGNIIYDKEPNRRLAFQMRSLKEYALLNEERQCIFNKLNERGFNYD